MSGTGANNPPESSFFFTTPRIYRKLPLFGFFRRRHPGETMIMATSALFFFFFAKNHDTWPTVQMSEMPKQAAFGLCNKSRFLRTDGLQRAALGVVQ